MSRAPFARTKHQLTALARTAHRDKPKLFALGLHRSSIRFTISYSICSFPSSQQVISKQTIKMFRSYASTLFLLFAIAVTSSYAQFRPPSLIGITHIVRYQNTACSNADQESGTCLADAECSRRAGTNIGTCANGYGTCCSFKVSSLSR